MFCFNDKIQFNELGGGVKRKVLAAGGKLMAVEVHFDKDAVGSLHTHPHEQISYVLSGRVSYEIEGEKQILSKGDSCYVAPNLSHGVIALEENTILLDVFTPLRDDFK
jgi:quercetin dioxygenase-like cupin family protein